MINDLTLALLANISETNFNNSFFFPFSSNYLIMIQKN